MLKKQKIPHYLQIISYAYLIKFVAILLSIAFVLIAPRYFGKTLYSKYVYYSQVLSVMILFVAFGSAGVINRFFKQFKERNSEYLLWHIIYRTKQKVYLFFAISILILAIFMRNDILLLAPLAIAIDIVSVFQLFVYAKEQYTLQLIRLPYESAVRLILLPVGKWGLVLYLYLVRLSYLAFLHNEIKLAYKYIRNTISENISMKASFELADVSPKIYRSVQLQTYITNLLYYSVPCLPILLLNNGVYSGLSTYSMSLYFQAASALFYNFLTSINDVLLPKAIQNRDNTSKMTKALFLWVIIIILICLSAMLFFGLIRSWLISYYHLEQYAYIYYFFMYFSALVMLNTLRQLYYVYDHNLLFNILLVLSVYVPTVIVVVLGFPMKWMLLAPIPCTIGCLIIFILLLKRWKGDDMSK